jgi:hypothetical protein
MAFIKNLSFTTTFRYFTPSGKISTLISSFTVAFSTSGKISRKKRKISRERKAAKFRHPNNTSRSTSPAGIDSDGLNLFGSQISYHFSPSGGAATAPLLLRLHLL